LTGDRIDANSPDEDLTVAPQQVTDSGEFTVQEGGRIEHYRMIRWLGSGGMGTVGEAVDENNGRRVAIKRNAESMVSDETYVKRFIREAQLAAQVSHPNVTFIYGAGNENGQPYIAMELMPGNTLADLVNIEGALACSIAVDHVISMIDGLIAVHGQGMIHRDVKPANCFLDSNGSVKIGDFGLSKSTRDKETGLTKTGTFMGTPSYAAPEQIRGDEIDGRTDLYSVGAALFFCSPAALHFSVMPCRSPRK
jgi:serine/threonine protein kinase